MRRSGLDLKPRRWPRLAAFSGGRGFPRWGNVRRVEREGLVAPETVASSRMLFTPASPRTGVGYMATRMLIDAAHPEETRVVVVDGSRLEEFDMESSTRKQLRGNIYLAKVTRVEPSLQAAFVDYGGNRHGFLAFSDIHPDYYQIPVADRQALLEQQANIQAVQDQSDEAKDAASAEDHQSEASDDDASEVGEIFWDNAKNLNNDDAADSVLLTDQESQNDIDDLGEKSSPERDACASENLESSEDEINEVSGYEGIADLDEWRRQLTRKYKIQEVIKRRQILLVQIVKEERGNKGAALTTYLSLAGRYCVLMPNSTRGGGISRKITNAADRKKLRSIIDGLAAPEGMRLIVRTAGQNRNKAEIRRDYDYLLRLWNSIRDLTLSSTAPNLIYEDANIIKRSIRDLYTRDITEILVDGEEGHKSAKAFMKMLMPSHARRVQAYSDRIPLFKRYHIEDQVSSMHSPNVQLKSGGYIVINPTEALVSIDVNSGRSTRERNIEETAYKTNLEAAEELARQLRLRDLAGLIVIDFIDMDENRNARKVERCLRDCLKADRARIQVGRISSFGLLEMSRQRLRPSIVEASTETCPRCLGTGLVRSTESSALHVLHAIEEEGIQGHASEIMVNVATPIALYILNQKRASLTALETRFEMSVFLEVDDSLIPPEHRLTRVSMQPLAKKIEEKEESDKESEDTADAETSNEFDDNGDVVPKKRRRRGRRGGRRRRKKEDLDKNQEIGPVNQSENSEEFKSLEKNTNVSEEDEQKNSVTTSKISSDTTRHSPDSPEVKLSEPPDSKLEEKTDNFGIEANSIPETNQVKEADDKPKRRGWWQRAKRKAE